ncbi:virulence factor TspB C-terminal domain-related protein [Stenotrophomonas sp. JC08]|uniref:virulence factor TspB C-terminal domain-related protein n=1 Tax=Stenotrophomonas sp. JC08 TaxID=3445779 RepID=UPI003FA3183D
MGSQTADSYYSGYLYFNANHTGVAVSNNFVFQTSKTCASRPDYNGAYPYQLFGQPRAGTFTCFNGCTEAWASNGDGSFNATYSLNATCTSAGDDATCKSRHGDGYYFNKHLAACEPEEPGTCPEGQEKDASGNCTLQKCPAGKKLQADGTCVNEKNECPAGNVKAPSGECLPGDGQCAAGEAKGKDGTCKRDSNGDGTPDSEEGPDDPEKDSASGGDSCDSPPSCNGNPIMCAQWRTQWRIDCNTRKNRNIAGGHCGPGGVPVCTGDKCDAMEYAQLLQTWKASCALEKLAAGEGGGVPGSGDPDVKAIKDALTGTGGAPDIGSEGTPGDSWAGGSGGGTGSGEPDVAGYGWGGTCPTPPTIDLMGVSINLDVGPLCSWLALGSYFVLGLAALGSLRIVGGGIA